MQNPTRPIDSKAAFLADLRRREESALGLQKDLLTEVPMLYGSAGRLEPDGDPGIILARLHREELVRRHAGGMANRSVKASRSLSPAGWAGLAIALAVLIWIIS